MKYPAIKAIKDGYRNGIADGLSGPQAALVVVHGALLLLRHNPEEAEKWLDEINRYLSEKTGETVEQVAEDTKQMVASTYGVTRD